MDTKKREILLENITKLSDVEIDSVWNFVEFLKFQKQVKVKKNNTHNLVVKYQLGKIDFPDSPEIYLPQQRSKHLIKSLSIDEACLAQLIKLPLLPKDPI
jgi:PIN domain nuclease of toxin-antitoxin system